MIKNEKWNGGSKNNSNSGSGRDGKFDKREVKSFLRGSRGAGKYTNERPKAENERFGEKKYGQRDGGRSYSEDRKSEGVYKSRSGNSFSDEKKPYASRDNKKFEIKRPYQSTFGRNENETRTNRFNDNRGEGAGRFKPRTESGYNNDRRFERNNDRNNERGGDSFSSNRFKPRTESGYNNDRRFERNNERGGDSFSSNRFKPKSDSEYGERKPAGTGFSKPFRKFDDTYDPNAKYSHKKQLEFRKSNVDYTKPLRLNKFLANAGICSRREADEYIQAGVITVNGEVVCELGAKVMLTDKVMFHNEQVKSERKVYLLLNKPKDCVTTVEDTHERLTVLDLVKSACSERIYPVGRLDRNTTGVLLLTNDGDLASKLTHPKFEKKKIYQVVLDKDLEEQDFKSILSGVTLDDLTIAADSLEYVKEGDSKQVGIEIHSGQNRVVRRIFESLGYKVIRLDRVYFAGLTKKNLQRGKYRFLTEREINMLKMGAFE